MTCILLVPLLRPPPGPQTPRPLPSPQAGLRLQFSSWNKSLLALCCRAPRRRAGPPWICARPRPASMNPWWGRDTAVGGPRGWSLPCAPFAEPRVGLRRARREGCSAQAGVWASSPGTWFLPVPPSRPGRGVQQGTWGPRSQVQEIAEDREADLLHPPRDFSLGTSSETFQRFPSSKCETLP